MANFIVTPHGERLAIIAADEYEKLVKAAKGIDIDDSRELQRTAFKPQRIDKVEISHNRKQEAASILIADVIAIYIRDKAVLQARPSDVAGRAKKLLEFWGGRTLDQVSGSTCREYVLWRGKAASARRELEDLSAAISYHRREGLCREVITVVLPKKGEPRSKWLTRSEVAKLLWIAWRFRDATPPFQRSRQHVARFILTALYTGTRAGAVCSAALQPTVGHGWIDVDRGVFYRRPEGERETTKRKPPVRLSVRLLAHMRRWKANGQKFVVEFHNKPVRDVDRAFRNCVREAKLAKVSPHTLRHTAATWLMQAGVDTWEASGFLGMSLKILERVYGHHHPDFQKAAADKIARKLS